MTFISIIVSYCLFFSSLVGLLRSYFLGYLGVSSGQCYEVDPNTGNTQQTNVVSQGGNYESFAQDPDDPDVQARFYTTEDTDNGALVRYCWFVELATEVQKIDALP